MVEVFLSLIIPIYNCERWIKTCLDSIINCEDFDCAVEVILVDDGSTDNTENICEEYANIKNVRYFKIANGGVGKARNWGIDKASGKYITFVDADDMVSNDFFKIFLKSNEHSDFVIANNGTIESDGKFSTLILNDFGRDNIKKYVMENTCFSVWGKRFSTELIRVFGIRFEENLKFGEDMRFVLEYIKHIKTYAIHDDVTYWYRQNLESCINNRKADFISNHNDNYIFLKNYAEENGLSETFEHVNKNISFDVLMQTIHQIIKSGGDTKEISAEISKTIFIKEMRNVRPLKRKILYFLLMTKQYHLVYLYKLITSKYILFES